MGMYFPTMFIQFMAVSRYELMLREVLLYLLSSLSVALSVSWHVCLWR